MSMSKKSHKYITVLILLVVLSLMVPIGLAIGNMTGPEYEFNNKVHSYMENAYFANTPELMISNLQKCKQGMIDLGLTENMYDAYWQWDKVPHRQMAYQYQHIDSIISRAQAVVQWRNENYGNESSGIPSESLGDVYESKMDNLRGFLQEDGWSDWIANGAYYANYHVIYYFGELIGSIWFFSFIIIAVLLGWLIVRSEDTWKNSERDEQYKREQQQNQYKRRGN
jgi:hypothetical protein